MTWRSHTTALAIALCFLISICTMLDLFVWDFPESSQDCSEVILNRYKWDLKIFVFQRVNKKKNIFVFVPIKIDNLKITNSNVQPRWMRKRASLEKKWTICALFFYTNPEFVRFFFFHFKWDSVVNLVVQRKTHWSCQSFWQTATTLHPKYWFTWDLTVFVNFKCWWSVSV